MSGLNGTLRIGSVGTSDIMRTIQEGIRQTENLTCTVVYSRDAARGRAFADSIGVAECLTSYEDMLAREDVDVVYIASPNALHFSQALQAIRDGKHVIVEKPLATTRTEAETLTNAAREAGVFILEAITTLFMPNYLAYRSLLPSLGKISEADICYAQVSSKYPAYLRGENPNIFNPALQAGALNDMGVYAVHVAVDLFGAPQEVSCRAEYGPNGIDLSDVVTLRYPELVCRVTTAKDADLGSRCVVRGENGTLRQTGPLNAFDNCVLEREGTRQLIDEYHGENRMRYELARFRDAILNRDQDFFQRMSRQSVEVASILEQGQKDAKRNHK